MIFRIDIKVLSVIFLLSATTAYAQESYTPPGNYFQILYDTSEPAIPGLKADFGYAVFIHYDGKKILLDTGTIADVMENNLNVAGVDVNSLDLVVITHDHHDHTGGLVRIREINPQLPIYVPPGQHFEVAQSKVVTEHIQVTPNIFIIRGHTDIPTAGIYDDLAIVLRSAQGPYVISSCSHSGAGKIIEHAKRLLGEDVYYFSGSDRLNHRPAADTKEFAQQIKQQHVQFVSPSHCSLSHRVERDLRIELGKKVTGSQLGRKIPVPLS